MGSTDGDDAASHDEFSWEDAYHGDGADPAHPDPALLARAADLAPGTALDLGCGAGGNAIALARAGWRVTGIDLASTAISSARIAAAAAGVEIDFAVADATVWAPPHPYDLVVSNFALPAAPDRHRVLTTAIDAVAPGGTIIVTEWSADMAARWGLDGEDFVTVDELLAAVAGLTVDEAAVIPVEAHHHGHASDDAHRSDLMAADLEWRAITVRARRA